MYRHVLVPTDGSDHSRRAAERAREIAERDDARVTVLATVRNVDSGELDGLGLNGPEKLLEAEERRRGQADVDRTAAVVEDATVDVATVLVPGVPHRAICEYAESTDVDLIVMGSTGRDGLSDYLFGTTTERVAQRSSVPVLVV